MKDWEAINQLKNMIETYEHPNSEFEAGVVMGLTYALTYLEHGKEYADQKVDMPKKNCGCSEGRECGC